MRFVGGPLHGQDIDVTGVPFLYEHEEPGVEGTDLRSRTSYVVQAFGSGPRPDGETWRVDVMVAEGVRQSGQLNAIMLDAFMPDLPGARRIGSPVPPERRVPPIAPPSHICINCGERILYGEHAKGCKPPWAFGVGHPVTIRWAGREWAGVVSHRLSPGMWFVVPAAGSDLDLLWAYNATAGWTLHAEDMEMT